VSQAYSDRRPSVN